MTPSVNDFFLAKIFVEHSLKIKPKEKVLISTSDNVSNSLVKATYIEILKHGAYPLIDGGLFNFYINRASLNGLNYQFYELANEWQRSQIPEEIINVYINWADSHVRITSLENSKELTQINPELLGERMKLVRPLFDKLINQDRWVLTYFPTQGMAQEAGVSLDWLLDFYYQACIVDYDKMQTELAGLEKAMDNGKLIHMKGRDTDLTVDISGRMAKACYGERNIPDGEVFLAPHKKGVNGKVYFEFPTIYQGRELSGIYLEFENGKVVKAKADHAEPELIKILDTDEGSRYLGEFAIGANYNITQAMKNTLFDEKIGGTVHMALGRAYEEERGGAKDGNKSAIHWDIVKDMRLPGSQLFIDDKLVLADGKILV